MLEVVPEEAVDKTAHNDFHQENAREEVFNHWQVQLVASVVGVEPNRYAVRQDDAADKCLKRSVIDYLSCLL